MHVWYFRWTGRVQGRSVLALCLFFFSHILFPVRVLFNRPCFFYNTRIPIHHPDHEALIRTQPLTRSEVRYRLEVGCTTQGRKVPGRWAIASDVAAEVQCCSDEGLCSREGCLSGHKGNKVNYPEAVRMRVCCICIFV